MLQQMKNLWQKFVKTLFTAQREDIACAQGLPQSETCVKPAAYRVADYQRNKLYSSCQTALNRNRNLRFSPFRIKPTTQ